MPGKCKFQDSWLSKVIYKDWLVKDEHDIHFARCRACCKSIKLQTMGEAALTSHAGGAGHKAALRKLMEGNLLLRDAAEQTNGSTDQDTKEDVSDCLQLDALDKTAGGDWSNLHNADSITHNAELQDGTLSTPSVAATVAARLTSQHVEEVRQQRIEALEQQQQMKILEWENRMKVLAWEQDLMKERRRAARQKEKAFRMKKAYYKAKLRRMGESVLPSSSSSSDEEGKTTDPTE
ncbi:uncharacterized protein fsbp isoform X2 [Takifugu rubripes]|nr:uncharacterized protein LOC105419972 isoform X2 [Takifugu rubripes]XP_056895973.1 uncharacterized protein LOC130529598 isoform X2 [Takifugu flavidus]|eukprot:XP_011620097.1 PREDICTED: uncharacterized protein LOC105419972 isoform X2 [Takifugu rubripes]